MSYGQISQNAAYIDPPRTQSQLEGRLGEALGMLQQCHTSVSRLESVVMGPRPVAGDKDTPGASGIVMHVGAILQSLTHLQKRLNELESQL